MTYSCSDFTDDIIEALKVEIPDEHNDSPSAQADLCLAEIERLQKREQEFERLFPPPETRLERIAAATRLMREARTHLRAAGAKNAADYVQRALKSVEGAERHARNLEIRHAGQPG